MNCIVGIVDKLNNNVVMGADSAASSASIIVSRKDVKMFRKGDFIIGCTTSYRMVQLLQYSLQLPEIGNKDIFEYLCTDFINAVRECFTEGGFIQHSTDGDEQGGHFLVAYKDRLFHIEGDFQIGEMIDGFDACGCGQDYALGVLYSLKNKRLNSSQIVMEALKAAERFSPGVQSPFLMLKTQ